MPNPLQTIAKSTRDQALLAVPKRTLVATIASVDYTGLKLTIFIDANSAAREVHLGINETDAIRNGRIAVGQKIQVLQEGSEFYASAVYPGEVNNLYLPLIANQGGSVGTPTGWAIVQSGASLYANWNAVTGAVKYEIWQNTTNSPVSATIANNGLAQDLVGTSYNWVLDPGSNSNLITVNPGFEGGAVGWTISQSDGIAQIVSSEKNSGIYSILLQADGSVLNTPSITTVPFIAVVAGSNYAISFYRKTTSHVYGTSTVAYQFLDVDLGVTGFDTFSWSTTNGGWTKYSATMTAPANSVWLILNAYSSAYAQFTNYFDDFSIIGTQTTTATYFAVRAIDFNGHASPFSSWLLPTKQSSALGVTSAAHLQLDPISAMIQSSNFVSSATGVKLSPGGIEGATIVSSTEPVAPFPGMVWIDTT